MNHVVIGVDPHKLSVTIEARDSQEILRATGRFGTDTPGYRELSRPGFVGGYDALASGMIIE
jgi:transposase